MTKANSAANPGPIESMAAFGERRLRELYFAGQAAEAAAREAYGQALREGRELLLQTQAEVNSYGAQLALNLRDSNEAMAMGIRPVADKAKSSTPSVQDLKSGTRPASTSRRTSEAQEVGAPVLDPRLAVLAQSVGVTAGVGRGAVNSALGLADGTLFVARLMSPLDGILSEPGQSASTQLQQGVDAALKYTQAAIEDPDRLIRDVQSQARRLRADLDPGATPFAATPDGEARRRFEIGMNEGEVGFQLGSVIYGGPMARTAKGLRSMAKAPTAQKYLEQGWAPKVAEYLAEAYPEAGMGHHFIPRRVGLSSELSDSAFNVLRPVGITRGDMYELHAKVDPKFKSARLPAKVGAKSWKAREAGVTPLGLAGRIWFGSPAPLKARVFGLSAGAGGVIHGGVDSEGDRR